MNEPLVQLLKQLQATNPELARQLIPDRIHPGPAAGLVMAARLLTAWNAPTAGHAIRHRRERYGRRHVAGAAGIAAALSVRPERCAHELVVATSPDLKPFTDDTLRVTDLPFAKASVAIDGDEIGVFSAEQLAAGDRSRGARHAARPPSRRSRQADSSCAIGSSFTRWRNLEVPFAKEPPPNVKQAATELAAIEQELAALEAAAARPADSHHRNHRHGTVNMRLVRISTIVFAGARSHGLRRGLPFQRAGQRLRRRRLPGQPVAVDRQAQFAQSRAGRQRPVPRGRHVRRQHRARRERFGDQCVWRLRRQPDLVRRLRPRQPADHFRRPPAMACARPTSAASKSTVSNSPALTSLSSIASTGNTTNGLFFENTQSTFQQQHIYLDDVVVHGFGEAGINLHATNPTINSGGFADVRITNSEIYSNGRSGIVSSVSSSNGLVVGGTAYDYYARAHANFQIANNRRPRHDRQERGRRRERQRHRAGPGRRRGHRAQRRPSQRRPGRRRRSRHLGLGRRPRRDPVQRSLQQSNLRRPRRRRLRSRRRRQRLGDAVQLFPRQRRCRPRAVSSTATPRRWAATRFATTFPKATAQEFRCGATGRAIPAPTPPRIRSITTTR